MSKIIVLSETLASQVAAGEVVERPASVLKELIENSLDAQATQIEVEVRRGGVALLKISDNGSGMNRTDAELCLERHATSKLQSVEGLATITTHGRRMSCFPWPLTSPYHGTLSAWSPLGGTGFITRRSNQGNGNSSSNHGHPNAKPVLISASPIT